MASAWDHAAQMAEKHASSGGLFVRLTTSGAKVIGAFCGEPFPREVVWTGERYEAYAPEIHTDKRPSLRVMINFFVPAEGEMKVIEGGTAWFKDVLKVRNKYGLQTWLFEVERHGDAGDPKTSYTVMPEEKISEALAAKISAAQLHDLAALAAGDDDAQSDPRISDEAALALVGRLKALPRSCVDTFLEQMRVNRIRELRQSELEAAQQLLGALEVRAQQQAPPPQAEVDPFA